MSIYAIADLHLSFDSRVDKPMDIYGKAWENHWQRLEKNWREIITDEDVVMIAGDISWALKPDEAIADLDWIHKLPGKKALIKGNHELWWQSITRLNKMYEDMFFLQNTFFSAGEYAVCGSRGWTCPGSDDFCEEDRKIYNREVMRLENSLSAAKNAGYSKIVAMTHFPPTNDKQQPSDFTALFEKFGVETAVYGHLHGKEVWPKGLKSVFNGVDYKLVSLDFLDAMPLKIR